MTKSPCLTPSTLASCCQPALLIGRTPVPSPLHPALNLLHGFYSKNPLKYQQNRYDTPLFYLVISIAMIIASHDGARWYKGNTNNIKHFIVVKDKRIKNMWIDNATINSTM